MKSGPDSQQGRLRTRRRARFVASIFLCLISCLQFREVGAADDTDLPSPLLPVADAVEVPPAPLATDGSKPESDAKTEAKDLSLDALLDLAEKDPQSLQSINMRPSTASDRLLNPDNVFKPDTSGGTAANSTGELMSRSFGVVTRSTSAINQDARLRGYSGSQLVGTANGMTQVKTRIDVDSLFSQLDPNLIESITVVPGPYAAEYGPGFAFFDAQLITPKRTDHFTSDSDTRVGYNTNGQQLMWRETASFSDRYSGAFVSFGQRMGNDYRPGSTSNDFYVPASYHEQDIFAAVSSDLTDRSRIDGSYLHQQIYDTELPGVVYDINNQNADQFNVRWTWRDDFTGKDRIQIQSWWNEATYQGDGSRASKQTTFFQQMIVTSIPILDPGSTVNVKGLSNNAGARANLLLGDTDRWQAKTGVDWRRVGQFHQEELALSNGVNPVAPNLFGIPFSSINDYGIFASGNAKLAERWTLALGERIDAVTYGINQDDPVGVSTVATPHGVSYTGFATPTRMLNMTYLNNSFRVTDEVTVDAGAAYAMRPPNITELYNNSASAPLVRFGNSIALGDSNLSAERNLQFDLGLTKRQAKSTFGVRGFHSEIHNYIGLGANNFGYFPEVGTTPNGVLGRGQPFMFNPVPIVPNQNLSADTASLGYVYRNIDRVTMAGFEMLGEQRAQPWLEFIETLNYTRATNHDPTWTDVYTGQVHHLDQTEGLPGIYPLNATVMVRFVEPQNRKWTAEWQSRMARQQDYLARSLGEVGTPGFIVHNINGTYRWTDHISLRTSILNVFNLNYYEHTSLAIMDKNGGVTFVKNPGISLFMGLECTF